MKGRIGLLLFDNEKKILEKIKKKLKAFSAKDKTAISLEEYRKYFDTLRQAFHLFEDVAFRFNEAERELKGVDGENLRALAEESILNLGGTTESCLFSLKDYDRHLHGPFLGVSDEGSAAPIIRRAALSSPKIRVIGKAKPICVGVAHDAERLAAVGEVAESVSSIYFNMSQKKRSSLLPRIWSTRIPLQEMSGVAFR